jgi:hypothetical protein
VTDLNASAEARAAAERQDALERAQRERLQRADDMRAVMGTVEGRRFVWVLLNEAGLFSGSYTGEAISSAYGEGKRAVAVRLMADLQAESRDAYVQMVAERLAALPERLAPSTRERLG